METTARKRLLIIDDDRLFCDSAREYLSRLPLEVLSAHSGQSGLAICGERRIDIVLLDQKLPDINGSELYTSILSRNERTKIIFITAYPDLRSAVAALKQGVHDYISKPFDPEELGMLVLKTLKTIDLERVARIHEYDCAVQNRNAALVGSSPPMEELRQLIARAGASRAPVVITGETGTGKNRVAKAIHYDHAGVDKPFVIVNCAAIPENLIESELFGVEKGAFTGAVQMKKGLFEMAEGGTLFLDEIGEMPVGVQSKLLGVLDEKTFKKIGGHKMIETDARVIAATNVDIRKALKDRTFRSDLYFRLNIIPMHIPPLREHRDDIPELTRHFIAQFSKKAPITLGSGEMENLTNYEWPGNIRELSNVIERSIILRNSDAIYPSRLISGTPPAGEPFIVAGDAPSMTLRDLEAAHIRKTLGQVSGNYTHAARALGISRSTLMRKINDYGIPV